MTSITIRMVDTITGHIRTMAGTIMSMVIVRLRHRHRRVTQTRRPSGGLCIFFATRLCIIIIIIITIIIIICCC